MNPPPALLEGQVQAYETELAAHLGAEHVVATSSGTAALQTALAAIGVRAGDEVLVPALTVVMTVAAVTAAGAVPILVDSSPDGMDFDYDDMTSKVTDKTVAVIPVYLWGRAGDTQRLRLFAAANQLTVIADACQALGTAVDRRQAGLDATVACFSTQLHKTLSTGEGGFLSTNDPHIAALARAHRSHWQTPPAGEEPLSRLAQNFRLAEPLARIGRSELRNIGRLVERRLLQTKDLLDRLHGLPQLTVLSDPPGQRWNRYAPLIWVDLDRPRQFCEHLADHGVPNFTGSYRLAPLDQMPMMTAAAGPGGARPCRNAAEFLDRTLAVVLTRHDDPNRIRTYADIIRREAARWDSA